MTKAGSGAMLGSNLSGYADKGSAFVLDGQRWRMDPKAVLQMASEVMPVSISHTLDSAGLAPGDIDHIIPHQASLNLIKTITDSAGLSWSKVRLTLKRYANTAAASIPITFDRSEIEDGQNVLMFGIGAGWNWGSAVVRW